MSLWTAAATVTAVTVAYKFAPTSPIIRQIVHPKSAPWEPSLSALMPYAFYKNPLEFVSEMHKKHGDAFSCNLLTGKVTFVRGKANFEKVMNAPEEKLSMSAAYESFLKAFGKGILTHESFGHQTALLERWLKTHHLESYISYADEVIGDSFERGMPGNFGRVDIASLLMVTAFRAAVRNFFGKEVLEAGALDHFGYTQVFSKFELFGHVVKSFVPEWTVNSVEAVPGRRKGPSPFAVAMLGLAASIPPERLKNPTNVFEDAVANRKNPQGPSLGDEEILVNLFYFFIFGSAFNSAHMIDLIVRHILSKDGLWEKLRQEQQRLDASHGVPASQAKVKAMKELREVIHHVLDANCMPFLMRRAKGDFVLDSGVVIPDGEMVAVSPRLEHVDNSGIKASFGLGKHICPAKPYSMNGICLVVGKLVKGWSFTPDTKVEVLENRRMLTFPTQPSLYGAYRRVVEAA